ncbi:hypothetical protein MLC59_18055 [Marinobacter bryozoorum]|uniref:hypothetical protein n=1 Tax=Marinobacter bryozoorum TaxID=256324 RepID=UPI002004D4D0|nr:hypothetical protein [Marinobacter bryozoorum]MCK7546065.1 hypothetical protein [Marinobacter bryozoorum]
MQACAASSTPARLTLSRTEFQRSQAALLPAEGIGAHGNFFIRVAAQIRGGRVYISARGYTPAMEEPMYKGAFRFFGHVKLKQAGRQIIRKKLELGEQEVWPDDRYVATGSVAICLPGGSDSLPEIEIEAGYGFNSGTGFATPIPPVTRIQVPVRKIR